MMTSYSNSKIEMYNLLFKDLKCAWCFSYLLHLLFLSEGLPILKLIEELVHFRLYFSLLCLINQTKFLHYRLERIKMTLAIICWLINFLEDVWKPKSFDRIAFHKNSSLMINEASLMINLFCRWKIKFSSKFIKYFKTHLIHPILAPKSNGKYLLPPWKSRLLFYPFHKLLSMPGHTKQHHQMTAVEHTPKEDLTVHAGMTK